jgi:hypothetical protein
LVLKLKLDEIEFKTGTEELWNATRKALGKIL